MTAITRRQALTGTAAATIAVAAPEASQSATDPDPIVELWHVRARIDRQRSALSAEIGTALDTLPEWTRHPPLTDDADANLSANMAWQHRMAERADELAALREAAGLPHLEAEHEALSAEMDDIDDEIFETPITSMAGAAIVLRLAVGFGEAMDSPTDDPADYLPGDYDSQKCRVIAWLEGRP